MKCKCKSRSRCIADYHKTKRRYYVFLNRREMRAVGAKELKRCPHCKDVLTYKVIKGEPHFLVSLNANQLENVKKLSGRRKGLRVRDGGKTFRSFNPVRNLQALARGRVGPSYRAFLKSGNLSYGRNPGIRFAQNRARGDLKQMAKKGYDDRCSKPFPPSYCFQQYKSNLVW